MCLESAAPQHFSPQSGCAPGRASTKKFSLAGSELGFVNFPPFCLKAASKIWPVSYFGFGQCGYGPLASPLAVDERSHQLVPQDDWHWKRRARLWQPINRLIHQASVNGPGQLPGVAQRNGPFMLTTECDGGIETIFCVMPGQEGSRLPVPDLTA